MAHGHSPPTELSASRLQSAPDSTYGVLRRKTHPITSYSQLNTHFPQRKTKLLNEASQISTGLSQPTLPSSSANSPGFRRLPTHISLDVPHPGSPCSCSVFPQPRVQLRAFPACQNPARIDGSAQIPLPIYSPFQSRQELVSPLLV